MKISYTWGSAVITLVIILISYGQVFAQMSNSENTEKRSLYVEPFVGLGAITTELNSPQYFLNYDHTSSASLNFGAHLSWYTGGSFVLQSGIEFLSFDMNTDYLNIPPTSSDDIFSVVDFSYNSVHVPVLLALDIPIGEFITVRPNAGVVLRFLGGLDYEEVVSEAGSLFGRNVQPIDFSEYESFGIATQFGCKLLLSVSKEIRPYLSANYFNGTSNMAFLWGSNATAANTLQRGNISNKGMIFRVGVSIPL